MCVCGGGGNFQVSKRYGGPPHNKVEPPSEVWHPFNPFVLLITVTFLAVVFWIVNFDLCMFFHDFWGNVYVFSVIFVFRVIRVYPHYYSGLLAKIWHFFSELIVVFYEIVLWAHLHVFELLEVRLGRGRGGSRVGLGIDNNKIAFSVTGLEVPQFLQLGFFCFYGSRHSYSKHRVGRDKAS